MSHWMFPNAPLCVSHVKNAEFTQEKLATLAMKMGVTTVTSTITISATAAEERFTPLLYATRLATWLGTPARITGTSPLELTDLVPGRRYHVRIRFFPTQ